MSFNCVHVATKVFGAETLDMRVYVDGSASFSIIENGAIQGARAIDPDEDGSDIAICGEAKKWFDKELAAGRSLVST